MEKVLSIPTLWINSTWKSFLKELQPKSQELIVFLFCSESLRQEVFHANEEFAVHQDKMAQALPNFTWVVFRIKNHVILFILEWHQKNP